MLGLYNCNGFFGYVGDQASNGLFIGDIVIIRHKGGRLSKGVVTIHNEQIIIISHTLGDSHTDIEKADIVSIFKHCTDLVHNETVNYMWNIQAKEVI